MLPNNRAVAIVLLSLLLLPVLPLAHAQTGQSDLYITSVVTKTQAVYNQPVQVVITVENLGTRATTSTGFEVFVSHDGACIDANDDLNVTESNPPTENDPRAGCTQRFLMQLGASGSSTSRVTREFTWMPTGEQHGNVQIRAEIRSLGGDSGTGSPDDRSANNVRTDLPPLVVVKPLIEATPDREIIEGRKLNDAWRETDVKGRDCPVEAEAIVRFGCEATPGQILNYRFFVHNKGNVQDIVVPSFVDIEDFEEKGWQFRFTDDTLPVPPGGSKPLGVEVVVPRTAEADATFNVDSAPAKVRIASGFDSTVTTQPNDPTLGAIKVKRVFGLNITHGDELNDYNLTHPEVLRVANVTEPVRFELLLNNSGNKLDRYEVKFVHGTGTINDSWNLPHIPVQEVEAGERQPLRIELTPPANASAGLHSINVTFQSTATEGGSTFRTLRLTAILQQNFTISGQIPTSLVTRLPADPASFVIQLRNDGNGHDNVTLRLDPLHPGWTGGLSSTVIPIAPFSDAVAWLNVTPPMNAGKDTEVGFYVNGTSSGPANVSFDERSKTGMLAARVRIREGSNIAATATSPTEAFVDTGNQTTYTLRVTNTGNVRDRFTIQALSESAAWRADATQEPFELEPLQSRDVAVAVTAPGIARVGESNVVTVNVQSESNALLTRTLTFTSRISGPDLFIDRVQLNSTSPYAGDTIKVDVPLGNAGNRAPAQNATLRVYLVQDGAETEIGTRELDPSRLRGGVRLTETFLWEDTLNHAGEGVLIAVIDPEDLIEEIEDSGGSNEASLAVTLRTFDLRVRPPQGLSGRPGQEVTYGEAPYTVVVEHRGNSPREPVRILIESENGWGRRQIDVDLAKGVEYNATITLQIPDRPGVAQDRLNITVIPRLRESAALRASAVTSVIDDAPPVIAGVTISPTSAVFGEDVRFSAVVRDATGLQVVRAVVVSPDDQRRSIDLARGEGDTWTGTHAFSFAGTYRVFVEAVDKSHAANANSSRDTVATFEVNAGTAPTIRLAEGQSATVRTGALVKLNVSDPNGIGRATYTIRGISYDLPPPYQIDTSAFPNGTLDVSVTAANIYGVETTQTLTLTLDNSAPGVTRVIVTPESPKVNEDVTLRIETDPGVESVDVAIKRDGQLVETRTATKERDGVFTLVFNPGEGDYTVDVSAKDAAGNVELESGAVMFSAKSKSFLPAPGAALSTLALAAVALGLARLGRGRRER